MRGILFTEYFDFISSFMDGDAIEGVLQSVDVKITGAYTSVGDYSFQEFLDIHMAVSQKTGKDSNEIACQFGHYLLQSFQNLYPNYFEGVTSGVQFLEMVGSHIHLEVKKLYPTANPPDIFLEEDGAGYLLRYRSHRPLSPVAKGLTEACLASFGDPLHITDEFQAGDEIHFKIERVV